MFVSEIETDMLESTVLITVPIDEFRQLQQDIRDIKSILTTPDDEVVTPGYAMERLGIKSYPVLWKMMKDGRLENINPNGRPRFRKSDIDALIAGGLNNG